MIAKLILTESLKEKFKILKNFSDPPIDVIMNEEGMKFQVINVSNTSIVSLFINKLDFEEYNVEYELFTIKEKERYINHFILQSNRSITFENEYEGDDIIVKIGDKTFDFEYDNDINILNLQKYKSPHHISLTPKSLKKMIGQIDFDCEFIVEMNSDKISFFDGKTMNITKLSKYSQNILNYKIWGSQLVRVHGLRFKKILNLIQSLSNIKMHIENDIPIKLIHYFGKKSYIAFALTPQLEIEKNQ